ncbi:MAG: AraC family transcriptional regulator [Bacteroidales bacterium]|nr:AraC family transcriptional regulator [Bacteroidales bacterium]
MEAILIIGFFEALFLAALLFSQKQKSLSDHILGSFFLLYAVNFALSFIEFYNRTQGFPYPFFINTAPPFILLHGPALWFYIKSLTDQNFRFKAVYLLHFLPFVAMLTELWLNFYTHPAQTRIEMITEGAVTDKIFYKVFVVAIAVSTLGYFSWGLVMLWRYTRKIKTYFSDIENIDLSWLKILLKAALVVYGIINTIYIIDFFVPVASFGALQLASFTLGAIYIVFLGFFGLRQGNLFETQKINLNLEQALACQEEQKQTTPSREEQFIHRLLEYMKDQKPFLDPELNLARLSDQLDVTPEYLSKILNTHLNRSFFYFVNRYRTDEFKQRCREDRSGKLTLMGMAYECGFNSKATFNRVFKNLTGVTPGEYVKGV